jgi:hypothetical protein
MIMKPTSVMRAVLFVSGLVAAGIGGSILLVPEAFYALNGIDLSGKISLLSEMRASGGSLLASGLLILSGAFVARFAWLAALVGCLTYISYGLSRGLSVLFDGAPDRGLILSAWIELAIGAACLVVLLRNHSLGQDRAAIRPVGR